MTKVSCFEGDCKHGKNFHICTLREDELMPPPSMEWACQCETPLQLFILTYDGHRD